MAKRKRGPARPRRKPITWVEPSRAARAVARSALARRKKLPPSRRGGLSRAEARAQSVTSGVARAESIAAGELQPAEDLRDFFSRFRGRYFDAVATGKSFDTSKAIQAWELWGGGPMRADVLEALGVEDQ